MSEGNRLMLCAGDVRREGWKTLDATGGDFIAKIPPLPEALKCIAWEEIEWIHGVGSLYPWEAEQVLSELRSVLAPGGRLALEQPDFRKAIEKAPWLFGDPGPRDPLIMNRWAYTPESLHAALVVAGFRGIELLPAKYHVPERDFRMEAFA